MYWATASDIAGAGVVSELGATCVGAGAGGEADAIPRVASMTIATASTICDLIGIPRGAEHE
jgi:hypothetical protein